MKKFLLTLLTGLVPAFLFAEAGGGVEFSRDAEASAYTHVTDVGDYERFSFQVIYSSVTPSTATVSDGHASVVNITVADYAGLNGKAASGTLTLNDGHNTASIDLAVITVNSKKFTEGTNWDRLATSTMTMASLCTAIDDDWEFSATVSSNVCTVSAGVIGTAANTWALTSSVTSDITAGTATLAGGQEYGWLSIAGVKLTEGTDWDAETSSDTTAGNIADAINADSTLSEIVTATNTTTTGVVTITSLTNGVNDYIIDVCDWTDLTPDYSRMASGVASDIDVDADTFYEASNGFSVGLPVLFSTVSAATPPTGLTDQTTYYAIPVTANTFQVSDTSTGAVAGAEIDITALTGGGSFTFAPIAFSSGTTGFYWSASNDGTNYVDITGASFGGVEVSSVSYTADGDVLYPFAQFPYRYIRFNYTGPTYGGFDLDGTINWRKQK